MDYDRTALERLSRCIKELRRLSPELPIQAAHVFLTVATEPGASTPELMRRTGLAQSSCSRNVALLSDRHRKGRPGLGLVTAECDPFDGRRHIMRLTAQGTALAQTLATIIGTDRPCSLEAQQQMLCLHEKTQEVVSVAEAAQELAASLAELTQGEARSATRHTEDRALDTAFPSPA